MISSNALAFNILLKREDGVWVAHCLELDIVAADVSKETAKADIIDLIVAQVASAFENDNLDFLFHPAPREVWSEFFACKNREENLVAPRNKISDSISNIIANTCLAEPNSFCHA